MKEFSKSSKRSEKKRERIAIGRTRAYNKAVARKLFGGKDIFKSKEEIDWEKYEKKKRNGGWTLDRKWWLNYWVNLPAAKKNQFRRWFANKLYKQTSLGKKPWTRIQGLTHVLNRMEYLSERFFTGKKLTKTQWDFIYQFTEWFGDIFNHTQLVVGNKTKTMPSGRTKWQTPKKKSGWIIRYRYEGYIGKDGKGMLYVLMKRGKMVYPFYNVPYVEYILMTHVRTSLGKYWWEKWLWKYSANKLRAIKKFSYSRRMAQFEKFLESR